MDVRPILQVCPSIAKNENKSDLMNARKRLPVALADGGSGEAEAPGPRPGPSAPGIVAAWLLLTFAALFVLSVPATAQTTVWSATLTVRNIFGDKGCDNSEAGNRKCSNSNTLSEDEFTDVGTDYTVTALYVSGSALILSLNTGVTTATQSLTLMIGGNSYAFADGTPNGNSTRWTWANSGLTWSTGDEVSVSLVGTNTAATGQPTISGTPQTGKTLTAAIDDIKDDNGLPSSASDFTYQWLRVDGSNNEANIGSNSSTYTVTEDDEGHTIKVQVSFTDIRGYSEGPLTSDAYPSTGTVVAAAGACPSDYDWCATMTVEDQSGTGDYPIYNDKFGMLTNNPFQHHGETFNVFEIYANYHVTEVEVLIDVGPMVPRGTVFKFGDHTFTADEESQGAQTQDRWPIPSDLFWYDGQEITVSLVFGNFPPEGTAWISGTAKRGQTLTAHISDVSDLDGLTNRSSYTYQWVRVDGSDETNIPGATSSTYRLVTADVGKQVKVRISFTDDEDNAETLTSDEYPAGSATIEHAPIFGGTHGTRHLVETVGAATVQTAADIGGPVTATDDPANEPLTYSLEGTDADKFTIVSSSGQIRTKVGERYDYETSQSFEVAVRADNANGEWATLDVTIRITNNTNEQPLAPTDVTVDATIGSTMSLDVSWTAPDNTGRPAITSYDLRYQKVTETAWTDGPQDVTGTSASITGLDQGTQYRVAVRATNADGDGPWSSTSDTSDGDGDGDDPNSPSIGRTSLPAVRFASSSYTAIEGLAGVTVTVELSSATSNSVTILLTETAQGGATASDYSGVPLTVTFAPGETQQTFTVTATNDAVDDGSESVLLGLGTPPSNVESGSPSTATVYLEDADISTWYVFFGASSYTATEGGPGARVTVNLNAPWKPDLNEALTVPLSTSGITASDYSGVPSSVTFQPGQTQVSFTVRATNDNNNDDGESVLLQFGWLPDDLEVGRGPSTTRVHLVDTDGTSLVKVSFGAATYTAVEGGAKATVSVHLDAAPRRSVTVPLTKEHNAAVASVDYTGVPASVTFASHETQKTFEITAVDDQWDDDLGILTLGFGTLPSRVSAGSPSTATVYLNDNDGDQEMLTVRFDGGAGMSRSVREGSSYYLGVSLDQATDKQLVIPLTVTNLGGATAADYSGVPSNVTFQPGDEDSGVIVRAVDDAEEDPGEGFKVSFGTLPAGVQVSSWSGPSTTFTIVDNDGLPDMTVSDASEQESSGDTYLKFVVKLSEKAEHEVRVNYTTVDGTAKAGEDYRRRSGTLVFDKGDQEKIVWVEIIDDDHDEDTETMTLVLSNPVRAHLLDATGEGRITNTDAMPQAFLGRFGRSTAVEVIAQVEERLRASRTPGMSARLAGRKLRPGMERDVAMGLLNQLGNLARSNAPMAGTAALQTTGRVGSAGDADWSRVLRTGVGVGDLLTGSALEMNRQTGQGGVLSLWSRGARARFTGREGRVSLNGRIATTMAGADYRQGRLAAGLSLAHSWGRGAYQGVDIGDLASSVTGLYPWLGYKASERISVWGVTGYGKGALRLTPGKGDALETGLAMAMAAAGMRGQLAASGMGGFGLAFKTDALWVATSNGSVEDLGGSLAATRAMTTRFRAALETSRSYAFGRELSLEPSLEVGLRQDSGDAETGAGVDLAGNLIASDLLPGLAADVRVRTLLMHQAEGFQDRGVSVSFSYDPTPATPLGLTARLAPSWGGQTTSGAAALWGRETMVGLARRPTAGNRLEAELGYAQPVGHRLMGTPRFGVGASERGRDYRLGYSLALLQRRATNFEVGVDAQRRGSLSQGRVQHDVLGRITARW